MVHSAFHRSVQPLPPSTISYLRTRLRCGLADVVTSPRVPPIQALLLFSLGYGAGARPEELAKMRLDCMLDADGNPASCVHFGTTVTKHSIPRRVAMHADIRADLLAFRQAFPDEQWVAFRAWRGRTGRAQLTASALKSWFKACLREVGLGEFSMSSGRKAFLESQRKVA